MLIPSIRGIFGVLGSSMAGGIGVRVRSYKNILLAIVRSTIKNAYSRSVVTSGSDASTGVPDMAAPEASTGVLVVVAPI